ncbi:MAG: alkyl hydroperoxide reductase subunit F [Bdellovibrionales bacterium]|nr:alkyl hydroperoxide reductase subunit F [Bdellovibrionales bacterium]
MLDAAIIDQLREVFSKLEKPVVLRVRQSPHSDQIELNDLLMGLTKASDLIRVEQSDVISEAPYFEMVTDGVPNGVSFRGVPGGHEFSSLVLSILYSDGKGKQPDAGIVARIRGLKGPIRLKTYISLTCENCPEVVQSLNLMAILHDDFEHEMVDGGVAQDEVEALGIQGVPSVVSDGKLVHSGKIQLVDLLNKLETTFGKETGEKKSESLGLFDVVVIGGGPAGATAAIYSVRKGLKTAMVAERFGGQLQETKGIENMISVPYTEGVKLAAQLNEHVTSYPVNLFEHRRVSTITGDKVKRILLESGEYLDAAAVVIATGAKWRELGIPGERDYIGQGVAFCAHCDGPFYKDKKVVVVGGGNSGVEAALDLAGIATSVVLLEYGDQLKADSVLINKLKALPNAEIVTNAKSSAVIGDGKKVIGLEYIDRKTDQLKRLEVDGVFVQIGLLPNSQFVKGLLEVNPYGEIVVDPRGRTSLAGVYAAGDVTTIPFKQIVTAMGDGAKVALTAFEDRMRATV